MSLPEDVRMILEEEENESLPSHKSSRNTDKNRNTVQHRQHTHTGNGSTGTRRPQGTRPVGSGTGTKRPQSTGRKSSGTDTRRLQRTGTKNSGSGTRRPQNQGAGRSGTASRRPHGQVQGRRTAGKRSPRKRKLKESLWLFPAAMLYNEILLKIFSGTGIFRHFFYMLFFSVSVGLFYAALTSFFKKKTNRLLTKIILAVNGVFFTAESLIKSVYTTYMSFRNLLSGAGNVATKYGGELVRSIVFGLPKIVLFMLPVIAYFICGKRVLTARRVSRKISAALAGTALILFFLTSLIAGHGKNAAVYGAQFDFNKATETFGLTLSQRLSFHYGIFGNKNSRFHAEEPESGGTGPEENTGAGETGGGNAPGEGNVTGTGTAEGSAAGSGVSPTQAAVPTGPNTMNIDFSQAENSSDEEVRALTSYVQSVTPTQKNEYTGLFKGKNLIMVCAESYCGAFISEELTPTLWRLTHNGLYFSEYYQPEWGGSTTTGEVAYLLGMASRYGDDSMIRTQNNNNYFSIGNQLQRLGYSSCAFHNGDGGYYERNNTHENLGYNQFIANKSGIEDLCGTIYPDDTTMFENTIDLYLDKQPFNIYYMTLSGHAKYEADEHFVSRYYDRVNAAVGDRYKEKTKYYICYQMELEESMKILVDRLEAAGIADDTVIVMVGDHYPYGLGKGEAWGNDENYFQDLIGMSDSKAYDRDRNNLVIWSGCLEHGDKAKAAEISDPVFSLDIVPTLSNLFGLEYDSRLLPGRDVFGGTQPLAFWNSLNWVTDKGKYDSGSDTFTPRDGVTVDEGYVERMHKLVQNKILQSRVTLDDDYFRLLFGADDVTFAGQTVYVSSAE
ncbi:MAG: sulfatase-like hydrolase/transferase [Lachnospiraceae bacterium]|nr:sulfatase-like hydrolase/transferase [Lachnospiraceae bacterium]